VRPSSEELEAAAGRTVADLVEPGLRILFCGINPSLWSAAVGAHFARLGNRFWKVLHGAGLTDSLLGPDQQDRLLASGIGITNLVNRATASAAELSRSELRSASRLLSEKVAHLAPDTVAFLGLLAYRTAFGRPRAVVGRQPEHIAGSSLWLLPNPSGLQARYQLPELASMFGELRESVAGHDRG